MNHFLTVLSITSNRYYDWRRRYGKRNQHNGAQQKIHWLLKSERDAIILFCQQHPMIGYRCLTYMMLDENVVAVSPASAYRVLLKADLLLENEGKPSLKGTGFVQPNAIHEHWHSDISYVKVGKIFYFLITVLDGYSRCVLAWSLSASMTEMDVELVLQRAHETYPDAKPRVISDNGAQYISKDFKKFINQHNMTHVTTSPYYPQSNGKIERYHRTIKSERIRQRSLETLEGAKKYIGEYVEHYNKKRLHSAIGYVTPWDKFNGREEEVFKERKEKLMVAKLHRMAENKKNLRSKKK